MGLLVAGLVILALIIALLVGGGVMRRFSPTYQHIIVNGLTVLISLVTTTLVLQYMPRLHIAFRHAFLGAVVTTFFWAVARWGFKLYIDHALTWDIMYGSLLSIIAGLTFLYYTCAILLLGAQITAAFYCSEEED
jgi:membrane protein